MTAFVIVDVRVVRSERLAEYRDIAQASIGKHGGRYLALSRNIEVLEGDWNPATMVVLEFPDGAAARSWYESTDYAPALAIAGTDLVRHMILVDTERSARPAA